MISRFELYINQQSHTCSLMNLNFSDHDEICFREEEIINLTRLLSAQLGITDLLKLRDHVELKIREIYEQDIQSDKKG